MIQARCSDKTTAATNSEAYQRRFGLGERAIRSNAMAHLSSEDQLLKQRCCLLCREIRLQSNAEEPRTNPCYPAHVPLPPERRNQPALRAVTLSGDPFVGAPTILWASARTGYNCWLCLKVRLIQKLRLPRRSLWSGLLLGGLLTIFVAMFAYVAYLFLSWGQVAAQQAPDMPPLELPKIVRPATEAGSATQVSEIPFFRPARRSAVAAGRDARRQADHHPLARRRCAARPEDRPHRHDHPADV